MKNISDYDLNIVLAHHPMKDKDGGVIATAVTNLDVHDIARLSVTFGFKRYYIATPIEEQKMLVQRIVEHWRGDYGKLRNNNRSQALNNINVVSSIQEAAADIKNRNKKPVKMIATSAREVARTVSMEQFANSINNDTSYLIVFGTGWGLTDEVIKSSDYVLAPLSYGTGYNHLSVRSAVSIIMDRLYNALGGINR